MIRLLLVLAMTLCAAAYAQDLPAAKGPGSYLALGGTVSSFQSDYGKTTIAGASGYLDANVYNRFGIEAEARTLRFHSGDGMRQTTYLAGPRLSRDFRSLRVYTKVMAGRGTFEFPYGYARGSYFVTAAGAGVDWRVKRSPLIVRIVDFEYQRWPQFTFGDLKPYGFSTGLSLRIF
jgi:hypothetical protein